ncbi:hypothetical protein [Egbenema bharatensis]|uniref:hypothetical protein n=1 Tax=Egbenema bharatensis TaxID=3463334 RepID=UPI003A899D86
MTDKQRTLPEEIDPKDNLTPPEPSNPLTTVELPSELVDAIHQHCRPGETATQAILEVLQSVLGQQQRADSEAVSPPSTSSLPIASNPPGTANSPSNATTSDAISDLLTHHLSPDHPPPQDLPPNLTAALDRLAHRLTQLEVLIPRMADLEGKSIAF